MVAPLYVVQRRSTNVLALEDKDVASAMRYIRDHADRPIRVSDVAVATGLSRRMLEIRFRKAMDRSLNDEVQRVHLAMAQRLLAETDLSIAKVAIGSGYNSASYLNILFLRRLGITPTDYRARVR